MSLVYGDDAALGERLDKALADPRLSTTLQASRRHLLDFRDAVEARHPDWAARVDRARAIRTSAVERAPELLDRFEQAVTSRGGSVIRAATPEDAVRAVLEIARRRGVKVIAKGKTMISEEIELNHALEAAGLTPVETDLGEWIVQLAGERPSHILAPVIHRSRGQIAEVLAVHQRRADVGRSRGPRHLLARGAALGLPRGRDGHHRRQLPDRRDGHRRPARERGQRPPRRPRCRACTSCSPASSACSRRPPTPPSWSSSSRSRRSAASCPPTSPGSSGPAADGDDGPEEFVVIVLDNGRSRVRDERRAGDPQLHPLWLLPHRLPCLLQGRRACVRLGLRRPDRRGADATPGRHAAGTGPQAAVPLLALRRLHRRLPRRHPAARPARARPRARQPRRRRRSRRARRLGRLGARLVEPPAVPRLGAGRRALGSIRAGLRARREVAGGSRDAAAAEHASRSTGAGATWSTASDRRVHRRARGRRRPGRRTSRTSLRRARRWPACSGATRRSASGAAIRW